MNLFCLPGDYIVDLDQFREALFFSKATEKADGGKHTPRLDIYTGISNTSTTLYDDDACEAWLILKAMCEPKEIPKPNTPNVGYTDLDADQWNALGCEARHHWLNGIGKYGRSMEMDGLPWEDMAADHKVLYVAIATAVIAMYKAMLHVETTEKSSGPIVY